MKPIRILTAMLILVGLSAPISNPLQAQAKRKRLLVIGAVKGWQHDATSQAMATLSNLGRESGLSVGFPMPEAQSAKRTLRLPKTNGLAHGESGMTCPSSQP